jgi:hypothetical protein
MKVGTGSLKVTYENTKADQEDKEGEEMTPKNVCANPHDPII